MTRAAKRGHTTSTPRRWLARSAIATVALLTLAVAALFMAVGDRSAGTQRGYIGSGTCGTCHFLNHTGWKDTLHSSMVQEATPHTVAGDFVEKNEYWLHDGIHGGGSPPGDRLLVKMVRYKDEFYTYIFDPETQKLNPYRITHVVGTTYRQTYLVHSKGIYFRVPIEWAIHQRRWVNFWNRQEKKDETVGAPMDAFLHPNGHWNEFCARCHTTGYSQAGGGQWSELGIACESCHGPGAAHAAYFWKSKVFRLRATVLKILGRDPNTFIIRPTRLEPKRAVSVCGQCHQADIYMNNVPGYVAYEPGADLSPHFYETPLEPDVTFPASNRTWPDGSPRGPGVLFRSFVESRCFKEGGVTCTDCHATHQPGEIRELLVPGKASDALCLHCHGKIGEALEAHTHHAAASTGSRCYGCHLPKLLEGLVMEGEYGYNRIRTHELDHIPYPEASVRFGGVDKMPNACSECHADRSAQWAVDWATRWYGPRARVGEEIDRRLAGAGKGPDREKTHGL